MLQSPCENCPHNLGMTSGTTPIAGMQAEIASLHAQKQVLVEAIQKSGNLIRAYRKMVEELHVQEDHAMFIDRAHYFQTIAAAEAEWKALFQGNPPL